MADRVNHWTRWTREEAEFLLEEWDGTFATAEVIAEILGRTLHAVTQRYYELQWGTKSLEEAPDEKPDPVQRHRPTNHSRGVLRITRVTVEVNLEGVCPNCWTLRAADGSCFCS